MKSNVKGVRSVDASPPTNFTTDYGQQTTTFSQGEVAETLRFQFWGREFVLFFVDGGGQMANFTT